MESRTGACLHVRLNASHCIAEDRSHVDVGVNQQHQRVQRPGPVMEAPRDLIPLHLTPRDGILGEE